MTDSQGTSEAVEEKRGFEAEVAKLLKLMVHSVYSEREIFLRELISNASDACDKLRYEALTQPELIKDSGDFTVEIIADKKAGTLTVRDNGIGMGHDDLISNLGTIARSGTEGFMDQFTGDAQKDVQLIGQFGVGFYSVFMVSDDVVVTSRRAGDDEAWQWRSDGEGSYTMRPADADSVRGTEIILHLKEDAKEYLEQIRLQTIIKTYSDHIALPISLAVVGSDDEKTEEPLIANEGSALWTRTKSEITEEQYTEFYRHTGHAYDEPAHTIHYKAEGMQEYSVLLFVPSQRPMNLFENRKSPVKLYVKRVFITDETQEMLPGWLRFMHGIIDSEDLPLNISREMLQNNPVLARISKGVTNKILSEFEKLASKDTEKYEALWENFGAVIKEGLYEDSDRRDALLKISMFRSTGVEGWTTLSDYVSRMKEGQDKIYYVTGADEVSVRKSPQLEGFKAKGIEVLLLSDTVDDFWMQMVTEFDGKAFQSITRGAADLSGIDSSDTAKDTADKVPDSTLTVLTTLIKEQLGDRVSDVRASDRLVETAVCLVADEGGMDIHLERMLKANSQFDGLSKRALEINPSHSLVKAMAERASGDGAIAALSEQVELLYDQARILEGETPDDPAAFAARMSVIMSGSIV